MKLELKRRSKRIQTRLLAKTGPQKRELKRIQTRLLAKNRPPRSESPDASAPSLVRLPSPPKGSLFGLAPSTTEKFVRFSQPPPKGLYGSLSHHRRACTVSSSPKGFARSHHLRKASPGLIISERLRPVSISERLRPVSSSPKGFARSHHLWKPNLYSDLSTRFSNVNHATCSRAP